MFLPTRCAIVHPVFLLRQTNPLLMTHPHFLSFKTTYRPPPAPPNAPARARPHGQQNIPMEVPGMPTPTPTPTTAFARVPSIGSESALSASVVSPPAPSQPASTGVEEVRERVCVRVCVCVRLCVCVSSGVSSGVHVRELVVLCTFLSRTHPTV